MTDFNEEFAKYFSSQEFSDDVKKDIANNAKAFQSSTLAAYSEATKPELIAYTLSNGKTIEASNLSEANMKLEKMKKQKRCGKLVFIVSNQ